MNQKSSLREVPQFVSWVLTGNINKKTGEGSFSFHEGSLSVVAPELQNHLVLVSNGLCWLPNYNKWSPISWMSLFIQLGCVEQV